MTMTGGLSAPPMGCLGMKSHALHCSPLQGNDSSLRVKPAAPSPSAAAATATPRWRAMGLVTICCSMVLRSSLLLLMRCAAVPPRPLASSAASASLPAPGSCTALADTTINSSRSSSRIVPGVAGTQPRTGQDRTGHKQYARPPAG